ncbi:endolytic transglycosylase MltG [bacterium]|jgi:UPF0755 protein|nr:endolytic transglycosylase MltG [bacterium]MBT4648992.1 endolytic transglycosylase MltG [bacterium]
MIKIIKFIILIAIIIAAWFFLVLNRGNDIEQKSFIIKSGQGVNEISGNLKDADLIKNKLVFETWLWLNKVEDDVKAGIYVMPADISIRRLANLILNIPANQQQTFTIIEGWHRRWPQLKDLLVEHNFTHDNFLSLTDSKQDWQDEYDFLIDATSNATLEGYLYPDTYFIDANTSLESLIRKSLNNFDKKLTADLRAEIAHQNKSIFEILTLASIVEREVSGLADKKMVADIFWKRIKAGIGLQSDATVNFVTGKGLAQPTFADLEIDSLYNTYKYRGLPPGPISSPSIETIEAVIYPTANEYYYFLTTPEGEAIYSKTYDEHLQNKYKYLD